MSWTKKTVNKSKEQRANLLTRKQLGLIAKRDWEEGYRRCRSQGPSN